MLKLDDSGRDAYGCENRKAVFQKNHNEFFRPGGDLKQYFIAFDGISVEINEWMQFSLNETGV